MLLRNVWAASHGARIAAVGYALTDDPTATSAAQTFYNGGGVVIMPSMAPLTRPVNPYQPNR